MEPLNAYIDHTLLKPDAAQRQVKELCAQAKDYRFASVCVLPWYVSFARSELRDSQVKTGTVIGFPLGAHLTEIKVREARRAIEDGAQELDMVMNIAAFKSRDEKAVLADMAALREVAAPLVVKVIIETGLLTQSEIVAACQLCEKAGVSFVKSSTGFSTAGARVDDVALMRRVLSRNVKIKASGGIRDFKTARQMIEAGAERIGTSHGVQIMREFLANRR